MKTFRMCEKYAGISPGTYNCISSFFSFPWILNADNYKPTDEEVIEWMLAEEPYILEVYPDLYDHGNGD